MRYSQVLTFGLGLLLQTTTAIPTSANTDIHSRQDTCTSPPLRKSWDDATAEEKQAYTDAAVCLTKIPSRLGPVPSTLHDDFSWVHNTLALKIHLVAAFLPWHRLFVHTYEKALQTECGYTGTMLYWDWVKDAEAPASASVWDSFGGDGVSPDGSPFSYCVRDGPFKDYEPVYYANDTRPHCLLRNFAGPVDEGWPEMLGFLYRQEVVDQILLEPEFLTFHQQLENGPHAGVHAGIAGFAGIGDMSPTTSPNDPIFYLVHAKVDQLWWTWQQQDPARLTDYSGNIWPEDQFGMGATLDDALELLGLGTDTSVRNVMNINNPNLCYRY